MYNNLCISLYNSLRSNPELCVRSWAPHIYQAHSQQAFPDGGDPPSPQGKNDVYISRPGRLRARRLTQNSRIWPYKSLQRPQYLIAV